jgi:hypothetical protein
LGLSVVGLTLLNASAGFSCSCLLGGLQALVCDSKDLEILTIDSQFAPQCGVLRASRLLRREQVWSGEHRPHLPQSLPRSEHCGQPWQPWPFWRQSTEVLLVSPAEILENFQTYLSLSVVSFALLNLSTRSESGQESIILILFDFLFGQGAASGFGSLRFLGGNLWGRCQLYILKIRNKKKWMK